MKLRSNQPPNPVAADDASHSREYLRPRDAAAYLGISASTLAKLRMRHRRAEGPPYMLIGKSVLYDRARLDRWLAEKTVK